MVWDELREIYVSDATFKENQRQINMHLWFSLGLADLLQVFRGF